MYLYTIVRENRYNILDTLRTKLGIKTENEAAKIMGEEENMSSTSDHNSEIENISTSLSTSRQLRQSKKFKVVISYDDYKKIKPLEKKIHTKKGRRLNLRFQTGWTDVFFDALWRQHKLPCVYKASYHLISDNYFYFKGKCVECNSPIFGDIEELPLLEQDVLLNILTVDTSGISHSKKRFLRKPKRYLVGKNILSSTASQWRRDTADQEMDYGDVEPPNLYKETVLRKAKQETNDDDLGLVNNPNPILSIIELKYSSEPQGSIHGEGSDPFYVHYWTPTQEHIYKMYSRTNWTTQYIDATGSLMLPIFRTRNKLSSAHIFLYQIVIKIDEKTVPICQQISEKQNITYIYFWLRNWLDIVNKVPNEVVCDYSKALLGSVSRAYCNQKTIKEYISDCFQYLQTTSTSLPGTYIRIDVAHIIHMVCRWKCLNGRKIVKEFYVRCIGLLIKARDILNFRKCLKMILTLAISETYGDINDTSLPTPSEIAFRELTEKIASGHTEETQNDNNGDYKGITETDSFYLIEDENEESDIMQWVHTLYEESKNDANVEGNRLSAYTCPDLIKPLLNISREFPLWTNVLVDHFGSPNERGTSARIESYFATLKMSILCNKSPRMRADKFVITHLRSLRGDIKLAQSHLDKKMMNQLTLLKIYQTMSQFFQMKHYIVYLA